MNARLRSAVAAATAALALVACSPSGKDDPLPTMTETQARELVDTYARTVAATLGSELTNYNPPLRLACEGKGGEVATDGRFYVMGSAQLPVAAEEQVASLQRIRDDWAGRGYEITDDRTFPDGATGVVAAVNPADRVQVSVESTVPPTHFALLVLTPCYLPPAQ